MTDHCYICRRLIEPFQWMPKKVVNCPVCGQYEPTERLLRELRINPLEGSYLYSGSIRELNSKGIIPLVDELNTLLYTVRAPKNPLESIDKILLYVAEKTKSGNIGIFVEASDFSIGYAADIQEFYYFINLARQLTYLQELHNLLNLRLTANGWKRVLELNQTQTNSRQAFVAMSFDPALKAVWENAFKPALLQTGYEPVRMDNVEHNGKIDDQIVAEIRKSGLVVADFTGQRAGVYFEAGLATGIGIPVIWTCNEAEIDDVHFDTRQYNYVTWSNAAELQTKLIYRIEATLPNRFGKT